jgi:dolichyl-phosphate-mannose-protein mannosyltransferase
MERLQSRRAEIACAVLLCLMGVNLIGQILRKSITADEIVLIPASYYHLAAGEFHLVYEHPPLCKILAGLPLLLIQPTEFDRSRLAPDEKPIDRAWDYNVSFWTDNGERFDAICFWARLPMIALTLGLGVLIFVFGRELFGAGAGLFAVALFSLEPLVLAHGRVVQTDIAGAFGFLLTLSTMHRYVGRPTARRALWIGVAAAVAMLAKFSMLVIGPALFLFFAFRLWRRRPAVPHLLLVCLTSLVLINAAYFFKHRPLDQKEIDGMRQSFPKTATLLLPATEALSRVLPAEFVLGTLWQVKHNAEGHPAGLLGMHSKTGWWYYFPVAFLLKTTWPFLVLALASLGWGSWRLLRKRDPRFLWLIPPFLLYTGLLLVAGLNIGTRYYLPGYALLFIVAGAGLARLIKFRRGSMVAALLLSWCAFIALRVYPNYVPYMNGFASGHPHWWYLSDSNLEWSDDVREMAAYLRTKGENKVRTALLGNFLTQFYGVESVDLLSDTPPADTRYVAIGASFLNGSTVPERSNWSETERVNRFEAYRRRTPEAVLGGSIYLFRMRD